MQQKQGAVDTVDMVHVGDGIGAYGPEFLIDGVAALLLLYTNEVDVGNTFKEWLQQRRCRDCEVYVGVGEGIGFLNGRQDGHVAKGRKAYDQDMLHFL